MDVHIAELKKSAIWVFALKYVLGYSYFEFQISFTRTISLPVFTPVYNLFTRSRAGSKPSDTTKRNLILPADIHTRKK